MLFLVEYLRRFGRFQRNARLYLVSNALSGVTTGIFLVLYNLYLVALGYGADFIGLILLVGTLGAGLAIFPAGWCVDRFGGKAILIWSSLLIAVAGMGLLLLRQPVPLLVSSFVTGVGGAFVLVVNAPFLTVNSTPAERSHLFSLNIVLSLVTTVLGKVVGGVLPAWLMAPLPPWLAGLLANQPTARSYQLALLLAGAIAGPSLVPLFLLSDDRPALRARSEAWHPQGPPTQPNHSVPLHLGDAPPPDDSAAGHTGGARGRRSGGAAAHREAWHPQGPPTSTQPPRATTSQATITPPDDSAAGHTGGTGGRMKCSGTGRGWGWTGHVLDKSALYCGCQARLKALPVLRSPLVLLSLTQVLIGLGAGLFIPYFNIYFVQHLHASSALFGVVDGSATAITALFTLAAPWLAMRVGKVNTIALTQLASIPLLLTIGLTDVLPLAAVLYLFRYGLMDMSNGVFQVFSMEEVPEQRRGLANSSYQASFQVAWALSAPLGGLIIVHLGYPPIFMVAAVCYLLSIGVLWGNFGRGRRFKQEREFMAEKMKKGES